MRLTIFKKRECNSWPKMTASDMKYTFSITNFNFFFSYFFLLILFLVQLFYRILKMKMLRVSNARKQVHTEMAHVIVEEGQSSESDINNSNSAGPSQDYESSYASLKLGLPY
ncbi:hypothetical protein R6Q57_013935 [Mikania cordata]